MRKVFIIIFIIVPAIAFLSCKNADVIPVEITPVSKPEAVTEIEVYIEKPDYTLSLYEPKDGCYLGAYILSNKRINFDIKKFDELTKKEHCNFVYNMKLGEPFPLQWVLQCYSLMKTPYIVIEPADYDDPFRYELLETTAKQFGELYIPIFLQFYPTPHEYDRYEYLQFFRHAYTVFKANAPNVALIWSIDDNGLLDSFLYYPSDEYVDWIGLNIYKTVNDNKDIEAILDYFYYSYQKNKPLMISQVGISHFTSDGHKYYTDEASEDIKNIYSMILKKYPRIKAINYMDFNNLEVSPESQIRDNFSVTDEEIILDSYSEAIKNPNFLCSLSIMESGDRYTELIKSPFTAYKKNGEIYISEKTLLYDLPIDINNMSLYDAEEFIDGNYYTREILQTLDIDVSVDNVNKRVILKEKQP